MAVLHRGCLGGKNVLFEKALSAKFFQVPVEASAAAGIVSLTVMIRTVIFHRIVLDRRQAPYPCVDTLKKTNSRTTF